MPNSDERSQDSADQSAVGAIDGKPFAAIAQFDNVASLMIAARRVRDDGYRSWDVHSPMPLHGLNEAMGLRPTILPWITLAHGVAGLLFGLLLVWWTNAITWNGVPTSVQGYEYFVSGKPLFSLPANIPILFETTVLFAAIGTLLGMLGLNKLPMLYNPLFKSRAFRRVTSDGFFVVVDAIDPQFDPTVTAQYLESLGSNRVELVYE